MSEQNKHYSAQELLKQSSEIRFATLKRAAEKLKEMGLYEEYEKADNILLAERYKNERDQLRALLVEAMVEECERVRSRFNGLGPTRDWWPHWQQVDIDWNQEWPAWFSSSARLIFHMRRGE